VLSLDDLAFAKKASWCLFYPPVQNQQSVVDLQSDLDLDGAIVGALLSGSGSGSGSGRILGVLRYSCVFDVQLGGRVAMPRVCV